MNGTKEIRNSVWEPCKKTNFGKDKAIPGRSQ
jgi:hypothetical protein